MLRLGYGSLLSSYALMNTGDEASNYGYWFSGKENDGAAGLKKFGAMLGDEVEVGCGSVLNPGTVIGKKSNIYPLSSVRKVVPANSIYKNQNEIVEKI